MSQSEQLSKIKVSPIREKLEEKGLVFTDEFLKGAAYLFPDGKYLCLVNTKNKELLLDDHDRPGPVGHYSADWFIKRNDLLEPDSINAILAYNDTLDKSPGTNRLQERLLEHTDGAIVVNDGTNWFWETAYVDLPPAHKPTEEQLQALTLWLDNCIYRKVDKFNVSIGSTLKEYYTDRYSEVSVDDIIKDIRNLYN